MLIAIQFPLADIRSFKPTALERVLSKPTFPLPETDAEFIRCFGLVRRRLRGGAGVREWNDEIYYCEAFRGLRFPDYRSRQGLAKLKGAFRRLFYDGRVVARVEVGTEARITDSLKSDEVLNLVNDILEMPSRIIHFQDDPVDNILILQDNQLAKLFAAATTETNAEMPITNSVVLPCQPLVLIEYREEEIAELPRDVTKIEPYKFHETNLAYTLVHVRGRYVFVWFLKRSSEEDCLDDLDLQYIRSSTRKVRLCLFRLHAEYQVLMQVLRLLLRGLVDYKAKTSSSDNLEAYLNFTSRVLFQDTRFGVDQYPLRAAVSAFGTAVSESERVLVFEQLQDARRQIVEKIGRITDVSASVPSKVNYKYYHIENSVIYNAEAIQQVGETKLGNTSITFGNNNTFQGDVIAAGSIRDSFNKASEAKSDDLQKALQELTTTVTLLCEKVPDNEEQQKISRRLKTIVEEATVSNPDKSFLKITGKGLIEAAKTVAEMVDPVTTAVKGVLGLLDLAI